MVCYGRFGTTYRCHLQGSGSTRRPFKMEPIDCREMPVNNNNNNNVILSSVVAILEDTNRLTLGCHGGSPSPFDTYDIYIHTHTHTGCST